MIGVLDYGMGNLKSVSNSLAFLGLESQIIDAPDDFDQISHLIIPGVGAFPKAMNSISEKGFLQPIRQFAQDGKPILGICLGMQLLADVGTEVATTEGLSLIPGAINVMKPEGLRIPHIGWNGMIFKKDHDLFESVKKAADVYFVHSYHFVPENSDCIVAQTEYGEEFVSVVSNEKGNVIGTQFHPEKSQKQGLKILDNFARMESC